MVKAGDTVVVDALIGAREAVNELNPGNER